MNEINPLQSVDNLLDYYDTGEIQRLIKKHITSDDFQPGFEMRDFIKPLWDKYEVVAKSQLLDEDTRAEYRQKFRIICVMFIDAICTKFSLIVDEGWLEELDTGEVQTITLLLYSMLITDLNNIMIEVIYKYIDLHIAEITEMYSEDLKNKRDATYTSLKTTIEPLYAIACANIYDIILHIMDTLNEDEFFKLINDDYIPKETIYNLYQDGKIDGDLIDAILGIYKNENSGLLSKVAFEIISNIKENHKIIKNESGV